MTSLATFPGHRSRWGLILAAGITLAMWTTPGWCGWQTFTRQSGLGMDFVTCMLQDRSETYWFGFGTSGGGLTRYDGATWKALTAADGLYGVRTIVEDDSGNLWFGTTAGAIRFDGENWRTLHVPEGLGGGAGSSLLVDRSGNMWFGTSFGLIRYDLSDWKTFTTPNSPIGDPSGPIGKIVPVIVEDETGILWFKTFDGALSRFDGTTWKNFTAQSIGLPSYDAGPILITRSGKLWVGGVPYGTVRYSDGSGFWRTFTTSDGLPYAQITPVFEDHAGGIWS